MSVILAELAQGACRFCVADTPEGQMHLARFCGRPVEVGWPYCPPHRRRTQRPAEVIRIELDGVVLTSEGGRQ